MGRVIDWLRRQRKRPGSVTVVGGASGPTAVFVSSHSPRGKAAKILSAQVSGQKVVVRLKQDGRIVQETVDLPDERVGPEKEE